MQMYRLHDFFPSGSGYKVRLLLHQLQRPYKYVAVQVLDGETRTTEFLEKNPHGKIPVLEVEPGQFIWESNAILVYLAHGTEFLPRDPWKQAKVMQWLLFEQGSVAPVLDEAWFWCTYGEGRSTTGSPAKETGPRP
ncbi:MAG: glutathione S-transferase N-terminal domain-containing protein [Prochlorothrix sp.]|nr:glutathione S-transferase N-terminal domain-containing protein [Prochlorothrix sp.]